MWVTYLLPTQPDVTTVHREHTPSHITTWTGPGFARVKDGAGLVFTINNIPYAMEYEVMIRYEPEVCLGVDSSCVSITNVQNLCLFSANVEFPVVFS